MPIQTIFILIAIAVIVAVVVLASHRKKGGDIVIPPAPQRADLGYCMFGCYGSQVADTRGWVNRHWEAFWQDTSRNLDACIADIKASGLPRGNLRPKCSGPIRLSRRWPLRSA